MKANERQIDNLVSLLDGYVAEGGHHLNVNSPKKRCWTPSGIRKSIRSSPCAFPAMR